MRFYSRGVTGKFPMSYEQLRRAFLSSGETEDAIRAFRDERVDLVRTGQTPADVNGTARAVLHLVPFSTFDRPAPSLQLDLRRPPLNQDLLQAPSMGGRPRPNADGLLSVAQYTADEIAGYAQLFRNGALEAVDSYPFGTDDGGPYIASVVLECELLVAVERYLELLHELGVRGPALLSLSIVGARSYRMAVDALLRHRVRPVDRDEVRVPEAVVHDLQQDRAGVERLMKPLLDVVWNACGLSGSPYYDVEGRWRPER